MALYYHIHYTSFVRSPLEASRELASIDSETLTKRLERFIKQGISTIKHGEKIPKFVQYPSVNNEHVRSLGLQFSSVVQSYFLKKKKRIRETEVVIHVVGI